MDDLLARDIPALSIPQLRAQITELAGHLNAAHHRWLVLIAEFDRRQGWSDGATQSCAHWLNWQCGLDMGAAREKVRVAHTLEKLPRISAAMERGALSYSKVRALSRVASEATEEYFLDIALHGTASHVEKLVRGYRRAREAEELSREARQQACRSLRYYYNEDGSLELRGCLPAEMGALVIQALDAALQEPAQTDGRSSADHPGGGGKQQLDQSPAPIYVSAATSDRPPLSARRADALGHLAETFLKHGPAVLNGGERHQIVVHVDAQTLREGVAGRCELEDGPSLAAETARRLACDASVVSIVENEQGEPLNVGRKSRTVPPAIRRALNARDRGCRFPGCSNTRYVDAHHVHHWAQGGETKLSNLALLCRFHHRQVHEGQVVIQTLDDGALRFLKPDGESFDSVAPDHTEPLLDWRQLSAGHRQRGIHIDEATASTLWRGESMDYGLAVEVLLQHAKRRLNISAEGAQADSGAGSRRAIAVSEHTRPGPT
jgi:Domain of unknown function (DUF222)/HNH endonuclease